MVASSTRNQLPIASHPSTTRNLVITETRSPTTTSNTDGNSKVVPTASLVVHTSKALPSYATKSDAPNVVTESVSTSRQGASLSKTVTVALSPSFSCTTCSHGGGLGTLSKIDVQSGSMKTGNFSSSDERKPVSISKSESVVATSTSADSGSSVLTLSPGKLKQKSLIPKILDCRPYVIK